MFLRRLLVPPRGLPNASLPSVCSVSSSYRAAASSAPQRPFVRRVSSVVAVAAVRLPRWGIPVASMRVGAAPCLYPTNPTRGLSKVSGARYSDDERHIYSKGHRTKNQDKREQDDIRFQFRSKYESDHEALDEIKDSEAEEDSDAQNMFLNPEEFQMYTSEEEVVERRPVSAPKPKRLDSSFDSKASMNVSLAGLDTISKLEFEKEDRANIQTFPPNAVTECLDTFTGVDKTHWNYAPGVDPEFTKIGLPMAVCTVCLCVVVIPILMLKCCGCSFVVSQAVDEMCDNDEWMRKCVGFGTCNSLQLLKEQKRNVIRMLRRTPWDIGGPEVQSMDTPRARGEGIGGCEWLG